jgi:AcrR family transcriptional regulator
MEQAETAAGNDSSESRILRKAEELFLKYGYSRVTVDEIAGELGMSKKTIYSHFSGKKALMRTVVRLNQEGLVAGVDAVLAEGNRGYAEKLKAVFGILSGFFSKITEVFLADMKRHCPDILRQINDFKKRMSSERIARILNEGMKNGMIRTDMNPDLLGRIYMRIFETLILPENPEEAVYPAIDMFDAVIRILYGGVLTDAGRKSFEKANHPAAIMAIPGMRSR